MTDLTAERIRKVAAEAQLAEMELAKARHEYVGVADVASAWSEVLSAVRGRLLSVPTQRTRAATPRSRSMLSKP